jgi:hypothetical protein
VTTTYPFGYRGAKLTLEQMARQPIVAGMDPEFQRRVFAMMEHAASVGRQLGIGGALRSSATQLAGFLARHDVVKIGGCCGYNGKRYALKKGRAHMAPPGRSYHEATTPDNKCLAADMVGDIKWMDANCARFGLREFSKVNNEPWHVQPVDIPGGRGSYNPKKHHPLPVYDLPGADDGDLVA